MGLFNSVRRQMQTLAAQAGQRSDNAFGGRTSLATGFVVIDVETTGLVAARDRVIEIALIATDSRGHVVDEWTTLINPAGSVGPTRIHGITAVDVRRAPRFADILGEINARLAGRALVAHNARFDLAFLQIEYARAGWTLPQAPYLCTLETSWTYLPSLGRRRLVDCCWASGIQIDGAHSALGDARATATLLASYLDPNFGRPPVRDHLQLPVFATHAAWPSIPRSPVSIVQRDTLRSSPVPAPTGLLAILLDDLPLASTFEEGAPTEAGVYLELLAEVLEDGILTETEAVSLAEIAKLYSLTRDQVQAAHRGFLLALAHKAVEDGKVTRAERDELLAMAVTLGFTDDIVKAVLNEARDALAEEKGKKVKPLPDDWPYGEPLRIGSAVAFTGCGELERARLEGRAQAAGLRVTGAVSRKTVVLVTDGANPHTTKAVAAQRLNVRIVTPSVFAQMVTYVQPALVQHASTPANTIPLESAGGQDGTVNASHAEQLASVATIRAWARQQGLSVGTRGRIPTEVVVAYKKAREPE